MTTELAVYKKQQIIALDTSNKKVDALLFNMKEAGGIKDSDLIKIKNPSGGALAWEVPNGDEVEYKKTLRGIIIGKTPRRTLWKDKSIGSGEVPVCSSNDMIRGTIRKHEDGSLDVPENLLAIGMPGGGTNECAGCPFNEWGTAVDGKGNPTRGKACQETLNVYLLCENEVLPYKLSIPGGSLKSFGDALKKLPVRWTNAVIELSLKKAKNEQGVEYAQYEAKAVGELDDEAAASLQEYGKLLAAAIEQAKAERPDNAKSRAKQEREDEIPEHLKM